MICQVCQKRNATTHLKYTVNGKTTQAYVCDHCASKQKSDALHMTGINMGSLFGGLFMDPVWREAESVERCATCGKSFRDIAGDGRVGCSDCYTTFYNQLLPSVQRIHGKTSHVGKSADVPTVVVDDQKETLLLLKKELQSAIDAQEYERCVELRDRIKQLEGEGVDE